MRIVHISTHLLICFFCTIYKQPIHQHRTPLRVEIIWVLVDHRIIQTNARSMTKAGIEMQNRFLNHSHRNEGKTYPIMKLSHKYLGRVGAALRVAVVYFPAAFPIFPTRALFRCSPNCKKKTNFWNLESKRPMEKISACTVQIWPGPIIASGWVHPQYNPDHGPVRASVSTPSPPGNPRPLSPRQRSPFPPSPLSFSPASAQSTT